MQEVQSVLSDREDARCRDGAVAAALDVKEG